MGSGREAEQTSQVERCRTRALAVHALRPYHHRSGGGLCFPLGTDSVTIPCVILPRHSGVVLERSETWRQPAGVIMTLRGLRCESLKD